MHAKPVLHPLFAPFEQQRCPLPPHGAQRVPASPVWQESPAPQLSAPVPQQVWPLPPQT